MVCCVCKFVEDGVVVGFGEECGFCEVLGILVTLFSEVCTVWS